MITVFIPPLFYVMFQTTTLNEPHIVTEFCLGKSDHVIASTLKFRMELQQVNAALANL